MAFAATSLGGPVIAAPVTYEMVTVGDAGNTADTTGYGAVGYEYRIGKYEVTIGQYTTFLNAVAKADPYGLYNGNMATDLAVAGIARTGVYGAYSYSPLAPAGLTPTGASSPENRPISYISWFDAARFANWMHNGQGNGDTETGAYTLNGATGGDGPAKNPGARFSIPTENEWYKAAYYKGGGTNAGYWTYATQSSSYPDNWIGNGTNHANYYLYRYSVTWTSVYSSSQNYLTEVGAFADSESAYGTFDQTGNVREWNDLDGSTSSVRGLRGGTCFYDLQFVGSSERSIFSTWDENNGMGFRLAGIAPSAVPEIDPAAMGSVLAFVGGALGLLERRRLKRAA